MIWKCANPECSIPFDYSPRGLFCFRRNHSTARHNAHSVEHFWLCPACSEVMTLKYRQDEDVVLLIRRHTMSRPDCAPRIAVA